MIVKDVLTCRYADLTSVVTEREYDHYIFCNWTRIWSLYFFVTLRDYLCDGLCNLTPLWLWHQILQRKKLIVIAKINASSECTTLWVRIPIRRGVLDTTLCDKVCQWLATGRWFSPVSSNNKVDRHDITAISLKLALNTITITEWLDLHFILQTHNIKLI